MSRAAERVVLNVGGRRYETRWATLARYPESTLGHLTPADTATDGEVFFDRNPRLFPYILDFYRHGCLHFPHYICGPSISAELSFWRLPDAAIAPCCWRSYRQYDDEQETVAALTQQLTPGWTHTPGSGGGGKVWWGARVWTFLEEPTSSRAAQIWAWSFMFLIIASIAVVCAETHPAFRVATSSNSADFNSAVSVNSTKMRLFLTTSPHPVLVAIDYICTAVFTLELALKFFVWPGKLNFFTKFFNIIDLLSVIPMLGNNILQIVNPGFWRQHNLFFGYCVISISNVFRAVRILKLVKHHQGLQVMYLAMRASAREILLLLLLITIGTLIFATMIFFAEFTSDEDTFPHIPIGFWWAIITMTTVGYGDRTPTSILGYVVGSACAVTGMLTTGLPIPVIANSFHLYHSYARMKNRLDAQQRHGDKMQPFDATDVTKHGDHDGGNKSSPGHPQNCVEVQTNSGASSELDEHELTADVTDIRGKQGVCGADEIEGKVYGNNSHSTRGKKMKIKMPGTVRSRQVSSGLNNNKSAKMEDFSGQTSKNRTHKLNDVDTTEGSVEIKSDKSGGISAKEDIDSGDDQVKYQSIYFRGNHSLEKHRERGPIGISKDKNRKHDKRDVFKEDKLYLPDKSSSPKLDTAEDDHPFAKVDDTSCPLFTKVRDGTQTGGLPNEKDTLLETRL